MEINQTDLDFRLFYLKKVRVFTRRDGTGILAGEFVSNTLKFEKLPQEKYPQHFKVYQHHLGEDIIFECKILKYCDCNPGTRPDEPIVYFEVEEPKLYHFKESSQYFTEPYQQREYCDKVDRNGKPIAFNDKLQLQDGSIVTVIWDERALSIKFNDGDKIRDIKRSEWEYSTIVG